MKTEIEILEGFFDKVLEKIVNSRVQIEFYKTLDPKEVITVKIEDNIKVNYTAMLMIEKEERDAKNNRVMLIIIGKMLDKEIDDNLEIEKD